MDSEATSDTGPASGDDGQVSNNGSEMATKKIPLTPWEHKLFEAVAARSFNTVVSILREPEKTFSQKVLDECLLDACGLYKESDHYLVREFLHSGASIKAVSEDGWTPILIAIKNGDLNLLLFFLHRGADVNAVTAEGDFALTLSVSPYRSLDITKRLLVQKGIDKNHTNHALMKAVETRDFEVMKLLIDDYKRKNSQILTISKENLDNDKTIIKCFGRELFDVATLAGMVKVIKLLLHIKQAESPLMEATLRADVELVKILTDSQFYDIQKDDSGDTTFLQMFFQTKKRKNFAIGDVDIPIIKLLLESGAKVNKSEKSWTSADPPVITAVESGSLGLVQLMCEYGAKLDVTVNSKTPLDVAAESGKADILQFLLSKHAKVYEHGEDVTYKDSPLHLCLVNGHTNCAEILLKHGYMIDVPSAAEYAIEYNHPAYLKFLLEKNPSGTRHFLYSTRQKGHTILMQKVRHDNMDIIDNLVKVHTHMPDFLLSHAQSAVMVQLLVRNGASVNRRSTTTGNPVLLTLIKSGKNLTSVVQIVDFLLEKGANVNNCNFEGVTPLIAAAQTWESSELLNTLLLHGADVHKRDCKGMTAFLYAVERNYTNNAKFLMQLHGKRVDDTELRNASGSTALVLAAKHNNKTIIELLLDREADVNVRDQDGDTALISAIKHGNRTIADLLIDRGANVNVEDCNGDTALTLTARKGNVATVMKILERGTNINHQNKEGYSALIIAALNLDKEFMEVLLNAGANVNVFLHEQEKKTAISLLFEAESYYDQSTVYVLMNSLLNKGASSSYLKPDAFFDLIPSNELKLIPKLVSSGFGPAELCSKEYLHNPEERVAFPVVSPFIFALLYSHPKLARYFDGNWFLSTSDIQLQAKHGLVKEILERRDKKECVDILDEFCSQPMSLLKLSFVAVSSAIGCVPGREERVEKLPLPPIIKDKLLFKKQEMQLDIPESATPSRQSVFWHDFLDYVYDSDNSGFYDSDDYGFDDSDDY